MGPTLRHHDQPACGHLSAAETTALLANAAALNRAARTGKPQPLLRGKHVGLLCDDEAHRDAVLFRRAAAELGAQVANIRISLSPTSTAEEVQHTARMLGQLYDAVECQGMDPQLVERVAADAGVPVFDGIATSRHPTAELTERVEGDASRADKRRYLLQALLLSAIA